MLALEVLQMCPSQRNALLSTLGALDLSGSKVIKFDIIDVKPQFPYHVAFQIHVDYLKYTIKSTIIDEGAAMCVMYLLDLDQVLRKPWSGLDHFWTSTGWSKMDRLGGDEIGDLTCFAGFVKGYLGFL
jgi:hypothetical protein